MVRPAKVVLDDTQVQLTQPHTPKPRVLPHLAVLVNLQEIPNAMETPVTDGQKLRHKVEGLAKRVGTLTIAIIISSAFSVIIAIYSYFKISNINGLTNRVGVIEGSLNANNIATKSDIQTLSDSIKSLEATVKDKAGATEKQFSDVNSRIDKYLNDVARDAVKAANAVKQTVPARPGGGGGMAFAKEILRRVRQQNTLLQPKDIDEIVKLTLTNLNGKYRDPELSRKVFDMASEVANYKTFVEGRRHPVPGSASISSCKDNVCTLSNNSFENGALVNSKIHYGGGAIKLKNVRFVNSEFYLDDTPEARKFLAAILRSGTSTITIDTSMPATTG